MTLYLSYNNVITREEVAVKYLGAHRSAHPCGYLAVIDWLAHAGSAQRQGVLADEYIRACSGSGNDPFVGQPYYIMLLFDAALEAQSC
jgi:hypothetical protein